MRNIFLIILLIATNIASSQVKIGDHINTIDAASILELESVSKALVITRVNMVQMNSMTPLAGAIVYNTDAQCIYAFDGVLWKSLCNSEILVTTASTPPTTRSVGDIWINDLENNSSVWDGVDWVLINANPQRGNGPPSTLTTSNAIAGDIYVNRDNGDIFTFNGTDWIANSDGLQFENGISKTTSDVVELGGDLSKPTTIIANDINTLALDGLQVIDDNTNALVTIEPTTGILRRTAISSIVQKEELLIIANNGQNQFNTPLTITNPNKIDVYRNGVKIDFSAIGSNLIELETNVICYQNDEIRIVQFF